jgi:hypothetical protein
MNVWIIQLAVDPGGNVIGDQQHGPGLRAGDAGCRLLGLRTHPERDRRTGCPSRQCACRGEHLIPGDHVNRAWLVATGVPSTSIRQSIIDQLTRAPQDRSQGSRAVRGEQMSIGEAILSHVCGQQAVEIIHSGGRER